MSDLNFSLLPWQQKVYTDTTRFKVIAAGRRCGKSRLAATTLIIEALRCPPGSAVLYVSPTMGQSRQIIWDLLLDLGRDVIQNSHVNNLDITMINGAKIYVRGADRPDTLRGVSLTYAVLDEVADIKPEAWEQVIRASLSDKKGRAMFIGTPKGRNWFHDLWKLGQEEQDKDWKSWHFTTALSFVENIEVPKSKALHKMIMKLGYSVLGHSVKWDGSMCTVWLKGSTFKDFQNEEKSKINERVRELLDETGKNDVLS